MEARWDSVIDSLVRVVSEGEPRSLQGCPGELVRPGKAQGGGGGAPSSGKLPLGHSAARVGCTDVVVSRARGLGPEDIRNGP